MEIDLYCVLLCYISITKRILYLKGYRLLQTQPDLDIHIQCDCLHACFLYEKQYWSSFWAPYVIPLYNAQAWRLGKKYNTRFPSSPTAQQTKKPNKGTAAAPCPVSWLPDDISVLCAPGHDLRSLHRAAWSDGETTAPKLLSTRLLCLWCNVYGLHKKTLPTCVENHCVHIPSQVWAWL